MGCSGRNGPRRSREWSSQKKHRSVAGTPTPKAATAMTLLLSAPTPTPTCPPEIDGECFFRPSWLINKHLIYYTMRLLLATYMVHQPQRCLHPAAHITLLIQYTGSICIPERHQSLCKEMKEIQTLSVADHLVLLRLLQDTCNTHPSICTPDTQRRTVMLILPRLPPSTSAPRYSTTSKSCSKRVRAAVGISCLAAPGTEGAHSSGRHNQLPRLTD